MSRCGFIFDRPTFRAAIKVRIFVNVEHCEPPEQLVTEHVEQSYITFIEQ
jgi:hypothetical protein